MIVLYGSLIFCLLSPPAEQTSAEVLLTVAESSDFKATARYEQVTAFLDELADRSDVVRIGELGTSVEGRSIPLVILADPPVSTPKEAEESGKLVVFAFGNIHAGEVCGKEALLMLARDIATDPDHPLLDDLIIVFAPIYNTDGNERVSKDNRRGQVGPKEGMGERANAQGLDLNRDYVKLEAPETRAMVRFCNRWNPAMIIDTHTTNGSNHQYTITYAVPRNPAGDTGLIEYVRDTMMPEVSRRLREESGYQSFFYGNFNRDKTKWRTYPPVPRYGTVYRGLRNRIAILCEAYAYAPYEDRVRATYAFVRLCLEHVAANKKEVREVLRDARRRTIDAGKQPAEDDLVGISFEAKALDEKVQIAGFVEEQREGKRVATGEPKTYEVEHFNRYEPTKSVRRPFAYLFPASLAGVVEKLQQHGIEVEELREDIELDLEVYRVTSIERSKRAFQGHHLVRVRADMDRLSRRVEAGTILVRTGQALGALAIYLLEPESDDGLCVWNFFDDQLAVGEAFSVLRLVDRVPLRSGRVRALAEDREFDKPITFEALYEGGGRPNLSGSALSGLTWLDDGEHYLQYADGRLGCVDAVTGRSEPFFDAGVVAGALEALPEIGAGAARRMARSRRLRMTQDKTAALFVHRVKRSLLDETLRIARSLLAGEPLDIAGDPGGWDDLFYCRLDGTGAVRLTTSAASEQYATLSPDGRYVAFVRDHDLYVVDVATQTQRALTTGGTSLIRNAELDWVYFEELWGRSYRGFWWSPDSTHIVLLQLDDTPVSEFAVVNQIPVRQNVEHTRYPKAGDPNPTVKVGVVPVEGGPIRWADLGEYDGVEYLVSGVGWTGDSQDVFLYVQDRTQTWLDLCFWPRDGGSVRKLFRETSEAWVEGDGDPYFLDDGTFVWASTWTGWRHLYHYGATGALITAVTAGDWEVRRVHVVTDDGWVYFSGTRDSHIAPNLYRVKLDGTGLMRLTSGAGSHLANVSPTGSYFIDRWSDHRTPAQVRLYNSDGDLVRTLDSNPVYDLEEYRLGHLELVQIEAADGFLIEASVLTPPDFDPSGATKYPAWFMTYAGPHAPTVRDSWSYRRSYDEMLAQMGFVVFRADPRSASGKGACSAWTAYRQLGVQELADIEEAIGWLAAKPYIDAKRIGMSGHSYGGFMTAYAMTHSELFAAGIAGAPVTDWRNYDTIYTERYMGTPQDNAEGYEKSSVVQAAENLHGRILILHGGMDDNVHVQNTLQFVRELQRANKQFEMMLYPTSRHGIGGKHYQRLTIDFIRRTLGTARAASESGAQREERESTP